mmetsp:Transcript_27607/g.79600  ORF Transcript_27607/g.79600 Transcript_27607/m.79600 type:complete len:695 (-) Transcript_27607:406-2490(-)
MPLGRRAAVGLAAGAVALVSLCLVIPELQRDTAGLTGASLSDARDDHGGLPQGVDAARPTAREAINSGRPPGPTAATGAAEATAAGLELFLSAPPSRKSAVAGSFVAVLEVDKGSRDCVVQLNPLDPSAARDAALVDRLLTEQYLPDVDTSKKFAAQHTAHFAKDWPIWPCLWGKTVAGLIGDENKFVCGFERYRARECVIYSFGSNAQTGFEKGMLAMNPSCEIHVFDPTLKEFERSYMARDTRWSFHSLGLAKQKGNLPGVGAVDTLPSIAARLGHDAINILKVDVEGAEWDVVRDWAEQGSATWPSVAQVLMEVHPHQGRRIGELLKDLEGLGFRLFHMEYNGDVHVEIAMVQRSFVPGLRSYTMGRPELAAGAPCDVARREVGQWTPMSTVVASTSFAEQLRVAGLEAARRKRGLSEIQGLPPAAMKISTNYPCSWTEEFAGGRPVCGLRERGAYRRPPCRVLAMSSLFEGTDFRRGVLSIAPSCSMTVVHVRTPPLHRPDHRCGFLLSPDGSGPAQCPDKLPCCAASGTYCGTTGLHCKGTNFTKLRQRDPLASPVRELDGPVLWVGKAEVAAALPGAGHGGAFQLDLLQASGSVAVRAALDWLGAGGRAGQVLLDFNVIDAEDALQAAETLARRGLLPIRKGALPADPFLGSPPRLELHFLSLAWRPDARDADLDAGDAGGPPLRGSR